MAKIVGGIGVSHTPTIGYAADRKLEDDPVWSPIFENFGKVRAWIEQAQPDVLFVIYNDHVNTFYFDHYSAFALGVDDIYEAADEGGGQRNIPPLKGHAELARHIGYYLMADEFDMSFYRDRGLDHGCFSPLSMLNYGRESWGVQIVPLAVGVLQYPIPSAKRCYRFGKSLRHAIESFPQDIRVAILATGGLSHQVHGERCGFNNPQWDEEFLHLLETDPEAITRMTHAELALRGGAEGVEIIMWLIMRGALTDMVKKIQRSYYLPSMTAIATLVLENDRDLVQGKGAQLDAYAQLRGIENVPGTYPFSLELAASAYKLNKFLHAFTKPDWRLRFHQDPEELMSVAGLSEQERDLVRRRDWRGLIHAGATFFVLETFGAAMGVGNIDIYAGMKGITKEEMLATRNAQITYSVAGGKDVSDD